MIIVEYLVHFLLNSYLNPTLFLLYLFSCPELLKSFAIEAFENTGTNNNRLLLKWYLVLMPGIYLIWLLINFHFLQSFNSELTIDSFLSLDLHWLQYLPFLFTAFTLRAYASKSGMEGNIMGFIFFPMLIVGLVINGLFYLYWIWNSVISGGVS
jgi:hypothetical protein